MIRSFQIQKWPLEDGKGRDDVKEEDRKVGRDGKRRNAVFAGDNVLWDRMFGMRIEDCRESRDKEASLAQILTVPKGIGKKHDRVDRSGGGHKMRSNEAACPSFVPAQARGIST
jgi:hypothetical protein